MRPWRIIFCLFLSVIFYHEAFSQATFVSARHETLAQNQIDVTFSQAVSFSPAPSTTGWSVRINGNIVPITAIVSGGTLVRVTFDASTLPGHTAGQTFVKPGETLEVSYNGAGALTSAGGVTPFGFQQSQNNIPFTCDEIRFFNQGVIPGRSPDPCAPVVVDFYQYQFVLSLRFRNSSNCATSLDGLGRRLTAIQYNIGWGDGTFGNPYPYISDSNGDPNESNVENTGFGAGNPGVLLTLRETKVYPATTTPPPDQCSWNVFIRPRFGALGCTSITQTTTFASYDTDNANTGQLNLPPSVTGTNRVCLGQNVNMQFSDNTDLNCRAAVESGIPNQLVRHVRVVYGSSDYNDATIPGPVNNIPDIWVGGVPVTQNDANGTRLFPTGYFPTGPGGTGVPDGNGVIRLPTPVTVATATTYMQQITTTLTNNQQVGQRFYVRLDYWDICNSYDQFNPDGNRVSIENYIEIIPKPPAPTTTGPQQVCYGTSASPFTVGNTSGQTTRVNWYNRDPRVGGAVLMTNPNGINSATFPVSAYTAANQAVGAPFTTSPTGGAGRVYSVWATQVYGATNSCESDPVEVVIIVKPELTQPGSISGTSPLCNGSSGVAFTLAAPATNTSIAANTATNTSAINFATEYIWSNSGTGVSLSATTGTGITASFNLTPEPNPTATRDIRVAQRYSSGAQCQTSNRTLTVTIQGVSNGGTISGGGTICSGSNTGNISISGQRGTITRWEVNTGSGFSTDASLGTANPINPVLTTGATATTYQFRAVVKNGTCVEATSPVAIVTVNPAPSQPSISTLGATTFCTGGSVNLISTNVNASSYQWFKDGVLIAGENLQIMTVDASAAKGTGSYTVRTIGIAPSNCVSPISAPVNVIVQPLPTASNPTGGGSVCSGNPAADIVWTLTGRPPFNLIYRVTKNGSTIFNFPVNAYSPPEAVAPYTFTVSSPDPVNSFDPTATAGDSYVYQIISLSDDVFSASPSCIGTSFGSTATVSIGGVAPGFDTAPAVSPLTVCSDGASTTDPVVSLDLNAASTITGSNYTLVYRINALANRTKLFTVNAAGVPTAPITLNDTELNPVGSYTIRLLSIISPSGCQSIIDQPFTFTVRALPGITTPPANAIQCSGGSVNFSVAATGSDLGYQWFEQVGGVGVFNPVTNGTFGAVTYAGANTATLIVSGVTALQNSNRYRVEVRSFSSTPTSCPVTSTSGTLTVQQFAAITAHPNNVTNCVGANISFSVNAIGTDISYQWQEKIGAGAFNNITNGTVGGVVYGGATSNTLTINGITAGMNGREYRVVVTSFSSSTPSCPQESNVATLVANPEPAVVNPTIELCEDNSGGGFVNNVNLNAYSEAITNIPGAGGYTASGPNTFESAVENRRITWYSATTPSLIPVTDATDVDGVTDNEKFFFVVSDLSVTPNCSSSGDITFTIRPLPTANNESYTYCPDDPPGGTNQFIANINLSTIPVADIIGTDPIAQRTVSYHNTLADAQSGANAITTFALTANTDIFARVTNTVTGCVNTSTISLLYQPRAANNQIRDALNNLLVDGLSGSAPFVNSTSFCANNSLVLLQINPATNPGATYSWTIPAPSYVVPVGHPANPGSTPLPEFEVLTSTDNYFVILKFPFSTNSPPSGFTSNFGSGIPISVVESLGACAGNPLTLNVNVEASPPKPVITGPSEVCANGLATYTITSGPGVTNTWVIPPGATITNSPTGASINVQLGTFNGSISVTAQSGSSCVSSPSDPINVTAIPRPTFNFSVNDLCSGGNVNSVVTLTPSIAAPLNAADVRFNWTVQAVSAGVSGTTTGSSANGVTSINEVLTNTSGINGQVVYSVTAIGPASTLCVGETKPITVTVLPRPIITPNQQKTICNNSAAAQEILLTPTALPTTTTFTWPDPDGAGPATAGTNVPVGISGTIHINDVLTNTTDAVQTVTYSVTANNGLCPNTPVDVVIRVEPTPKANLVVNTNPSICSGGSPDFTFDSPTIPSIPANLRFDVALHAALPTGVTATGVALTGVTNIGTLPFNFAGGTIRNTTSIPQVVSYRITPKLGGCADGTPVIVNVTVDPEPVYGNGTQTLCSSDAIVTNLNSFKTGTGVTATAFNITAIASNGLTAIAGTPAVANGVLATDLADDRWRNTTTAPVNVVYTIVPVNGTCEGAAFTVTITVTPEPVYSNAAPVRCSEEVLGIDLSTLKNGAGVNASSFDITNIDANGLTPNAGGPTTGTGFGALEISNDSWTNETALPVNVVYTIVPFNGTCPGAPFTVTVSVSPEPDYADLSSTFCSDDATGIDLNSQQNALGVTATTFNITNLVTNGLVASAGSPAIINGVSNLELIDDRWTNITANPVNVVYTIVPMNGTCAGNAFTVTLTITPEPVYNSGTPAICSSNPVGLNLNSLKVASSVTANAFNITNIVDNGLTPIAGAPAVANGVTAANLADDRWRNTTAAPVDVVYTIVPVNGLCQGTPFTVTVTVTPEPVYNNVTPVRCSDEVLAIDLSTLKNGTGVDASAFNVTVINTNGLTASAGSPIVGNGFGPLEIINDSWRNLTASTVDVIYTITPVNGTCPGAPFTVTVSVDPEPVYANSTPLIVCSDDASMLDLNSLKNASGITATSFNIISINTNGLVASAGSPLVANGVTNFDLANDAWTNTTNSSVSVIYTIVPLNGTCEGTPFTVTLSVTPEPVFNSASPVVCSGEALGLNLNSLRAGASVNATTFNITNIDNNGLSAIAGSPTAANGLPANNLADDRWENTGAVPVDVVYTIVPVNGTCTGTAFTVTVTVNPEPVYAGISPTVCSDDATNIDLATLKNGMGVNATGFNITAISSTGVTASAGNPATGINLNALTISDDRWTNVTASPVVVTYTIVPVAGTCLGTPFNVAVTITPEPVYNSVTVTRCSDEAVNLDLITRRVATSVSAGGFNITSITSVGVTPSAGAPITGNGFGPTEITDDRWTNTTLGPVNVVYTIVPVNGTCEGTPFTVTVIVNPEPVGLTTAFIKCNEESFNLNLISVMSSSAVLPSTFDINVNSNGLTFAGTSNSDGNGKNANELFDDKWINTTSNPVDVVYTLTPISSNNCAGSSFTLTFTINPKPTTPAVTTAEICSDGTFNFNLQTVVDNTLGGGNAVPSVFSYSVTSGNPLVSPGAARNTASSAPINDTYENRSNTNALITYLVTPISTQGCPGSTFEVRLTVRPEPVGISLTEPKCVTNLNENLQAKHINVAGGNNLPSIFSYTVVSSNPVAVPPGANRTTPNGLNLTDTYNNLSGSDVTITYTITPYNAAHPSCAGTPFTYVVTISSKPVGAGSTATAVCSDVPFNINPQNNITNGVTSSFTWTITYDPGLSGPASGSGSTITGTFNNNTAGVKNAYFEVTPSSGTCAGAPFTIVQPINPEPVVDPSITPRTICSDTPTNITFGGLGGTTPPEFYDVTLFSQELPDLVASGSNLLGSVGSSVINVGDEAIKNDVYTNDKRTSGLFVEYLVTPKGSAINGSCVGDALLVRIEVLPEPKMNPALANVSVCSDVASNIELTSDGIGGFAANFVVNSINVTGTPIPPGSTVGSVVSKGSNRVPGIAQRNKDYLRTDQFNVKTDVPVANRTVVYNVTPVTAFSPTASAFCFGDPFNINLEIKPEPVIATVTSSPICSDVPFNITIDKSGTSVAIDSFNVRSITWQTAPAPGLQPDGSNFGTGIKDPGALGLPLLITDRYTNITDQVLSATYVIAPYSGDGCLGDDNTTVVNVSPAPAVAQGLDAIVCSDSQSDIVVKDELTSTGFGFPAQSYQIVRGSIGALTPVGALPPLNPVYDGSTTNAIRNDRFTNATNNPINVTYAVTAWTGTGATGCSSSRNVVLTVEPQIRTESAVSMNLKEEICSGDVTRIELRSPSNPTPLGRDRSPAPEDPANISNTDITFNYTVSGISGGIPGFNIPERDPLDPTSVFTIEQTLNNNTNAPLTAKFTITPRAIGARAGLGCVGAPTEVFVKVQPKPRMTASRTVVTTCEDDALAITLNSPTSSDRGDTYFDLVSVLDPDTELPPASVTNYTNPSAGTRDFERSATPNFTEQLVTSAEGQQIVQYKLLPRFDVPSSVAATNFCGGDTTRIIVTVSPRARIAPISGFEVCSGTTFDQAIEVLEADDESTSISWNFSPKNNPKITGPTIGFGDLMTQVIYNNENQPVDITYSVKGTSFGCEGPPIQFVVKAMPVPKLSGLPTSQNLCNSVGLNVELNNFVNVSNASYHWIAQADPAITGAANDLPAVDETQLVQNLLNTGESVATVQYTITPVVKTSTGTECPGSDVPLFVLIAPTVNGAITNPDEAICKPNAQFINLDLKGQAPFTVVMNDGTNQLTFQRAPNTFIRQFNPTVTTTYTLERVTDAFGCTFDALAPGNTLDNQVTIRIFDQVNASFDVVVPDFVGGKSTVAFTNTSTPIDGTRFDYAWDFNAVSDINSVPPSSNTTDVNFTVDYTRPGLHEIILVATNKQAGSEGFDCISTFRKTINIPVPPLRSAFTVTPLAACYPTKLTVVNNSPGADTFEWEVYDQSGRVATSNLPNPVFDIANPGIYDVFLTASLSLTGQQAAPAEVKGIEVYDKPVALFEARPTTLFVPDTELQTFNNSQKSNLYIWDFDDGTTSNEFEPTHFYIVEGKYNLQLVAAYDHGQKDVDGDGILDDNVICYDTATRVITAREGGVTRIPNAFTPNPNGPGGGNPTNGSFNDVFLPITKGVVEFEMQIFDRWGILIFETKDKTIGWDGYDRNRNLLPAGVYVYKLTMRLADGQRTTQVGDVTLIR